MHAMIGQYLVIQCKFQGFVIKQIVWVQVVIQPQAMTARERWRGRKTIYWVIKFKANDTPKTKRNMIKRNSYDDNVNLDAIFVLSEHDKGARWHSAMMQRSQF